jgi:hypothetical protein
VVVSVGGVADEGDDLVGGTAVEDDAAAMMLGECPTPVVAGAFFWYGRSSKVRRFYALDRLGYNGVGEVG